MINTKRLNERDLEFCWEKFKSYRRKLKSYTFIQENHFLNEFAESGFI